MADQAVRWNVKVSKETDVSLRSFLGQRSNRRGELSRFVEEAVLAQVFHRSIEDLHLRNRDLNPAELGVEIETALREVRGEARKRGSARRPRA